MNLGYKRKLDENDDRQTTPDENVLADPLFEAEWDEFVIKFDRKRGKYNVETSVQTSGQEKSESARN